MTEKYWKEQKERNEKNKDNINPILQQTYDDMKSLESRKDPKVYYMNCLQGALTLRQWSQSDDLTIDDMGLLICKDVGCELTYCQSTMSDPHNRPFNDCNLQFRNFNQCIGQQISNYEENSMGLTMQEYTLFMIEKRKKEKYSHLFLENNKLKEESDIAMKETPKQMKMDMTMDENMSKSSKH